MGMIVLFWVRSWRDREDGIVEGNEFGFWIRMRWGDGEGEVLVVRIERDGEEEMV